MTMSLLQGPTPQQMEAIRAELGEDPDRLQHNIQLLQKWISCQVHLPRDYDNNLLPVFLRGCKHNLERAKKKLEMYFIVRTKVPELFGDREPTKELMERYTKMIKIATLPKLTPDGSRITIFKVMCLNGDEWDTIEMIRYIYMNADIRVAEEVPISGDIFIYDLENLKTVHILKYASPILKKALVAAQEAYPQRLKQLHYVNTPPFTEKILNITKSFMKEKMRDRFIVHNSMDDLLKYFPSDILPVEYAGTSGKFNNLVNDWVDCIVKRRKWFQQQDNIKATGPIPECVSYSHFDDVIGVQGSFRKLEID
ncbi:hypothetical protein ILUMI_26761 [Ignelater luminosus]|uniref:CRAL-TRIO domain-containing protein n=1 Tax=Ignelater luminosus TaxID=2038154 RepID=A0A8K0C7U6_IGNLU|nr:hypothetical protein ILUMI_26761 [Ignelater luminosus]